MRIVLGQFNEPSYEKLQFAKQLGVAIANVLGSNLFNILGILGMSALVTPLSVADGIVASDNWWMLGVTLLLFPIMFTGLRVNRWEGCLLLSAYAVYLGWLLTRPA